MSTNVLCHKVVTSVLSDLSGEPSTNLLSWSVLVCDKLACVFSFEFDLVLFLQVSPDNIIDPSLFEGVELGNLDVIQMFDESS